MKFKIDGVEQEIAENIRVGEMCEAEKSLGISAEEVGLAGKLALSLFVTLKRAEPEKPSAVIAKEVFDTDMSALEEVEDDPPAEAVEDLASRRITGHQPSARSA